MRVLSFVVVICIAKGGTSFTFTTPSSSSSSSLHMSKTDLDPRSFNEFPRPYRTEIVLGARRNEYATTITATPSELSLLASRFSLSSITKLDADVVLKRDMPSGRGGRWSGDFVRVTADVVASVTQTCVRTNEDFEVDIEFGLRCVVHSCSRSSFEEEEVGGEVEQKPRKKKGKKRRGNLGVNGQTLGQMKMTEIEDLLQGEGEGGDEEVVEDPAIFGDDGVLDAGELVAQSFRLKLDPYPKKPGTEPVTYSITG